MDAEWKEPNPATPSDEIAPDTSQPRLLMVEDDPYDAELELRVLRRHGLGFEDVVVVRTEADYLARLEDFNPDVILADYRVPGLMGDRTLELALERCPQVPFIFVSGTLGEDRAVDLLKQGAWDYVLKDRPSRLGPAVSRSLDEARQRQRLEQERRQALDKLQESTQQMQAIIDTVQDALCLLQAVRDEDGTITDFTYGYANPIVLEVLHRDSSQVIGHRLLEILPTMAASPVFRGWVDVVETGKPFMYVLADLEDGPVRGTFEGRAAKLGDGFVVTFRDITEQRRAAEELAASQARLRATIDSLLDPCVLLGAVRDDSGAIVDFRFTYANDAACLSRQLTFDELVGRSMAEAEPDGAASPLLAMCAAVVETGEPLILDNSEYAHAGTGSSMRRYDIRAAKAGDGVSYTWRDVTDRHAAEQALRQSEARYRGLVLALGEGILVQDQDGIIVECNEAAERILGEPRGTLIGRHHDAECHVNLQEDGSALPPEGHPAMVTARTGQACRDVVLGARRRDGTTRWLLTNAEPLIGAGTQELYGVVTSYADITELRRAQQELETSEERFRLAFDEALTGMALIDVTQAPGRYLRVNRALSEFLGYAEASLLSMSLTDVTRSEELPALRTAIDGLVNDELACYRAEQSYLHASGATVWGLLSMSMVRDHHGEPLCALAALEDITARKHAERALAFKAMHDELTGLPNRALLLDHLRTALKRAQRASTVVGVLFIDLDDFKSVNDSFGHVSGDGFLVQVAERISGSLRETDTAARIGGDEFVVVCENLAVPTDATVVAQRIQSALSVDIPIRGQRVGAPASIGIAISNERSTAEDLLRDADAAMYIAKRQGGRRWEPADAFVHTAAMRMLALEGDLRDAIRLGQLRLYYQPTFDLMTLRMVGVEALLRWQHPTKGLLPPQELIEVAERRNLIGAIGAWVLETACGRAAEWVRRYGPEAPVVAVNISSRQLGDQGLPQHIERLLGEDGLPPDYLCLEITESQFITVGSSASNDLRVLSRWGIGIAVDDFGTGFAGFDYLRRFPVDTLKIDKSYVDGLGVDRTDTAIVASVVTLARNLGLTAIAEGIETDAQLQALQELGCARGQGWLWHPALPGDEVDALIARQAQAPPSGTAELWTPHAAGADTTPRQVVRADEQPSTKA